MIISIIVAMDTARGIGFENKLPWKLSDDLKRFKQLTLGHHIIMGRKTFESVGKPLPGRKTIIISRNPSYQADGCSVALSLEDALETAQNRGETEAFICGGASIYKDSLPIAGRIYLTCVHTRTQADTIFPSFDLNIWRKISASTHEADEHNEYPSTFQILERRT
jgi:dihydrofolate reductase